MEDLKYAGRSYFELNIGCEYGSFHPTALGRQLLEKDLIMKVENGAKEENFRTLYSEDFVNLAFNKKWVKWWSIKLACGRITELYVVPGESEGQCKVLRDWLTELSKNRYASPYAKKMLLTVGLIKPGDITEILKIKKGKDFPKDDNELRSFLFRVIDNYVKNYNLPPT